MDIRFRDHATFQTATLAMVGGAVGCSALLHPFTDSPALPGAAAGIAIGASIAYGRTRLRMLCSAAAVVVLVVATLRWATLPALPMVGAGALLALSLLDRSAPPRSALRGVLLTLLATAIGAIAMVCAVRVFYARETVGWSGWLTTVASAAAMAMVYSLALLPRHLVFAGDPVRRAMRALPSDLDAEVSTLCGRASAIWDDVRDHVADDAGRELVREGVLKTLEVAARSARVKTTGPSDAELTARLTELDTKIAGTSDREAKVQYEAARTAIEDQRRYRTHIANGRERLVARMHNHIAALEKFQLAANSLEAAREEGSVAMKQLAELSQNVAASGEALAEVELGDSAPIATAVTIAMSSTRQEPDAESNALA